MRRSRTTARTRGFSLVEVMVAVIVICVGLLGIAKMQALALSNSNTSRLRSLAALEAASLAAAMHTNQLYWSVNAPQTVTLNAGAIASSDAVLATQATLDLANLGACVGTTCAPRQLAAYDLANWVSSLALLLPNPSASILCQPVAGVPASCTIQISWTEKAVAMNQQEAAQSAATQGTANAAQIENPTYQLYVQP
jgi:type IV pilus assembly protein PilV